MIKIRSSPEPYDDPTDFTLQRDVMKEQGSRSPYVMTRLHVREMFARLKRGRWTTAYYRVNKSCLVPTTARVRGPYLYIGCQRFDAKTTAKIQRWANS